MIRTLFALAAFVLTLAGCGSVPPAPVDRFYRLQPVVLDLPAKALAGGVALQPFRADSLYAERPLVYGDEANPRQLRQYHYHLWFYAPAQLVQDHLAASLGKLVDPAGKENASRLEGRILRFDRMLAGKSSKAVVALELRLMKGNKLILGKTYTAERMAADESVAAHVVAVEEALAAIYAEFLKDCAG